MANTSPLQRVGKLLVHEKSELWVLLTYSITLVIFSLLIPLTMNALVNTVAAGLFVQPLVILALLVFGALFLGGVMQMMQLNLVEAIQQRIFAENAMKIADVLARACPRSLRAEYIPELVNRFFDVLTVQKAVAKLLVDGATALVQATLGLAILGFYSPALLLLDLVLIVGLLLITLVFGIGGLRTSIAESKQKYQVADWLEDIARCNVSLKVHGNRDYLAHRADESVLGYVRQRKAHFAVTIRQVGSFYIFQAFVQATALAGGGWQVINGGLTLGQLVAAQIIITTVLAALEKLVRQADIFFDLLTGLDKVGHVADIEIERMDGRDLPHPEKSKGLEVICRNVGFNYDPKNPILNGINLTLQPGERVSLVGASGAGKSTLGALLCGLDDPSHGTIELDGVETRTLSLDSLRSHVSMIGYENELFDGTIEENILVGRDHISPQNVRWALEVSQLIEELSAMPDGLRTKVISMGKNLSRGQVQRLLIARAIVGRPRLLILDEAFTGIDERQTLMILDEIFKEENDWTIIDISHDPEVVLRSDKIYVLQDGLIKEGGPAMKLATNEFGAFCQLFPRLSRLIRIGGMQ